ncbi:unnamed protein product, partial [Pylaiella littoralis]
RFHLDGVRVGVIHGTPMRKGQKRADCPPRVQSYTLPIWPGSVLTTKHSTYTPRILTSSKLSATFAYVSYFVLGGQLVQDVQQQPSLWCELFNFVTGSRWIDR